MTNDKWSRASLRITSQVVTAHHIASVLSLSATTTHEMGDIINPRKPDGPRRKQAARIMESGLDESLSLDLHITALVRFAETRIGMLEQLRSTCHFDIYCGFSSGNGQGGFVLAVNLLQRLADLSVDIILSLYPPEAHAESEPS